jgi:WD40 repeat protein
MDASQTQQQPGTNFTIGECLISTLLSPKGLLRCLSICLWPVCLLGLWHLTPATPRAAFWGGKETCLHAFSPDGNTLVTTAEATRSWDCPGPIHLWDAPSGRERATFADDWSSINDCQFSPDGTLFAAMNEGNHLKLWETATGQERADLPLQTGSGRHLGAKFSPDGRFIIYERCDPVHVYGPISFQYWEIETQQIRASIGGRYGSMEIAADGKTMNYAYWEGAGKGYTIERWRFVDDPQVVVPTQTVTISGSIYPHFSPNLDRCITFNHLPGPLEGDELTLWDTTTGKELASVILTGDHIYHEYLQFLQDGSLLIGARCGGRDQGYEYRYTSWDGSANLKEIATCRHKPLVSEDGRWLLVWIASGALVLDTVSGKVHGELRNPRDEEYRGIRMVCGMGPWGPDTEGVLGPDGKTVVITGLGRNRTAHPLTPLLYKLGLADRFDDYTGKNYVRVARLWDVEQRKEMACFPDCQQALYSPDGKTLATAHEDGAIRLWDLPPRKPILSIVAASLVLWFALLLGIRLGKRLVRRSQRSLWTGSKQAGLAQGSRFIA